ncbi:MAG TPA: hypothetical protein VOB72_15750 [Candidatus Dormibacteraeota bacterium]|nr:hypothetical protein [Candidatus Dormibacteraeota bacterium]
MWPTPVQQPGEPSPWQRLDRRARVLTLLGLAALAVATAATALVSMRFGQSRAPVFYTTGSAPAAIWTWDGAAYSTRPVGSNGPASNSADMAYDRARGVLVLWDHGCTNLVMGFTGGCVSHVNRTWTWDGERWSPSGARSAPVEAGPGAMLYDSRAGRVVYVNGAGRAWAWTGADWRPLATNGAPHVVPRESAAVASMFAAGYDEGRDLLVFALPSGTWTWDGTAWTKAAGGGIDPADARADAHLVYDRTRGQLVYVGSRFTWTWDGAGWRPHDQPAIASGTAAYDAARGAVLLLQQDAAACDRTGCRTATWTWDGAAWTRVAVAHPPVLALTRSGASLPPMAFDEGHGVMVLFASAS